jgi:hypothetical protein
MEKTHSGRLVGRGGKGVPLLVKQLVERWRNIHTTPARNGVLVDQPREVGIMST